MQDNTETIKSDIVNTLEMLYDSCHLTRDNVNTDVRKILAKHLGDDYDSVYNKKVKEQIEDVIVDYLYTFCGYEDSMFADKPFNPVVTNVHYKINYDEKLRDLSIELP